MPSRTIFSSAVGTNVRVVVFLNVCIKDLRFIGTRKRRCFVCSAFFFYLGYDRECGSGEKATHAFHPTQQSWRGGKDGALAARRATQTADPSTPLRSGRDDKFMSIPSETGR